MIEYILIMAMVAGIILGVMWGLFKPRMEAMQAQLGARLPQVVAQRRLGIPLQWFLGGQGFDAVDQKLSAAESGYKGSIKGAPGQGGAGGPRQGNGSSGDDSSGAGAGNDIGGDKGSGGNRGNRGSSATNATGDEAVTPQGGKRINRGSGGDDTGSSGSVQRNNPQAASGETKGEKPPEAGGPAGAALKKAGTYNDREQEGGGCGNMNLFTLLKIAAIVALLLLIAAVVVTGKGQKGKD